MTETKLTAQQRAALRERGFADGYNSRPKRYDHPEYLTSYRRGSEAARESK